MYDEAPFNFSAVLQCYERKRGVPVWSHEVEGAAQNTGEVWFYSSIKDHFRRTWNPEEADVFYVPIFPLTSFRIRNCRLSQNFTHDERMLSVAEGLKASPYWKRHMGKDYLFVCHFPNCKDAMELLRGELHANETALLSITERKYKWAYWGCPDRLIVSPYVANIALTRSEADTVFTARYHSFFFVGCTRGVSARAAIGNISTFPSAYIDTYNDCRFFTIEPKTYATMIQDSKFCLSPRGDTLTSRRLFDSIEAGCIPILEDNGIRSSLPFSWKIDYDSFAIFAPLGTMADGEKLIEFVTKLLLEPEQKFVEMQKNLFKVRDDLLWGTGSPFADEKKMGKAADNVLQEAMWRIDLARQRNWNTECTDEW